MANWLSFNKLVEEDKRLIATVTDFWLHPLNYIINVELAVHKFYTSTMHILLNLLQIS